MVTCLLFKCHILWSFVGLEGCVGKFEISTHERAFWLNLQSGLYFNTVRNKFPFCLCHKVTQKHVLQSADSVRWQLTSHVNRTLSGKKEKFVMAPFIFRQCLLTYCFGEGSLLTWFNNTTPEGYRNAVRKKMRIVVSIKSFSNKCCHLAVEQTCPNINASDLDAGGGKLK